MKSELLTLAVLLIASIIGLERLYQKTVDAEHRYEVLREVAQMKLEGQADMEVIMNVKSTADTKEVNDALDQLRKENAQ